MGAEPLSTVGDVPWHEIKDSTGSAEGIPLLLRAIAWGAPEAARGAVGQLRDRICQYGFVVEQATAATVPFLWELAQLPGVTCRAQIIELLGGIAAARQWEDTAAVYPKLLNHRENHVVWEREAREAVRSRRGLIRQLAVGESAEIAKAARELARAIGE
ncbi:hypothetical protein GCM10010121_042640 [Streptomyces brasiliensis]|uniref:AbaA n=1 Tax=Streptomyces brasiliensis TaxID=1954 RepID=A0A917NUN0_9ACTN|nr:hypothetical protein [Streptomyces brasiliensis]GGJ26883.1 hypothetical protein GCM10010121_042640 [Streptomyces brasiliensis]